MNKNGRSMQILRTRVSRLQYVSNHDDASMIVHDLRFEDSLLIFKMITCVKMCLSTSRIMIFRFAAFIQDDLICEDAIIVVQNHDHKIVDATPFLPARAVLSRSVLSVRVVALR